MFVADLDQKKELLVVVGWQGFYALLKAIQVFDCLVESALLWYYLVIEFELFSVVVFCLWKDMLEMEEKLQVDFSLNYLIFKSVRRGLESRR